MGRELRHRFRYAHRRERRGLQATLRPDRQAEQADDQSGPSAVVACRHQDARRGDEESRRWSRVSSDQPSRLLRTETSSCNCSSCFRNDVGPSGTAI